MVSTSPCPLSKGLFWEASHVALQCHCNTSIVSLQAPCASNH